MAIKTAKTALKACHAAIMFNEIGTEEGNRAQRLYDAAMALAEGRGS